MSFNFNSPKKENKVLVDAKASVSASDRKTSNYNFSKGLHDYIHIPFDTFGTVKIELAITVYLPESLNNIPIEKDVAIKWNYSKHNGLLSINSWSISPRSEFEAGLGSVSWRVRQMHDIRRQTLSVVLTLNWDDDGPMEVVFSVTNMPKIEMEIGQVWMSRRVTFGPFRTNSSRSLEKGNLIDAVRTWFKSIHPDTQKLIENASSVSQLPAEGPLIFEGYTSTLGSRSLNHTLGWKRAIHVRDIVKQVSGNNNLSIFLTPSRAEGFRETDNRKEENNNPDWRIVRVTFWDTFD